MIKEQEILSRDHKEPLFNVLSVWIASHQDRKVRNLHYGFQVNSHTDIRSPKRPIPFSLREAVREEINPMIREGIKEVPRSTHVDLQDLFDISVFAKWIRKRMHEVSCVYSRLSHLK
jgi:hypothetical protein